MKHLFKTFIYSATVLLAGSCSIEETRPVADELAGQKVTISFTAEFPQESPESKVFLDSDVFSWKGDESATLIFGKTAENLNNPTLASVSPGVFEGEVTIPDGFAIEDLQGIVIPSENGANFRYHSTDKGRLRMFIGAEQTCDGGPDMSECPFFYVLSSSDLVQTGETSYGIPGGIKLKCATDLIKFNIYGTHAEMEEGEILKSIRLDNGKQYLTSTVEYNVKNDGTWNVNKGRGGTYVSVSMTESHTIADKTQENGVTAYACVALFGVRTANKITLTTDRAVYTKDIDQSFTKTTFDEVKAYRAGINLANGFTRESFITYSKDGGQTWVQTIPETFSTLAVNTASTIDLTADALANIKAAIAKQSTPVDLDLRETTYESTIFPAIFNGTADNKGNLLKSISFPANVTEIAASAFEYCMSLESVDLTGINTINTKSFYWSGLKSLEVPQSVTSFGDGYLAFGCCPYLTEIYYDSPALQSGSINHAQFAWATMEKGTSLPAAYSADSYPELFPAEGICKITFGPNVKHISRNMFKYNKGIAEAVFYCAPVIYIAGFFELNNIHTFDFSTVTTLASGSSTNTNYIKNIGNLAKSAGKTLRILVPSGCTDKYKNSQPFKQMTSALGWTIVEQNVPAATETKVRIGTYNVRYYTGDTSSATNKWDVRKHRLVQSIKDIDFDIFGVQEAMDPQIASLEEMIGDIYGTAYFRPQTGASSDSSVGIFYKKSDWILTNVNTFWLGETPDQKVKGDTGAKGNYYRGAICGVLINKTTNARLFFMDSHGCLNPEPNETYAQIYLDKEAALNTAVLPSFFVGDLNTKPETNSSILFRTYWNDTYLSIDESLRGGCEYTYNGFTNVDGSSRIDYVYYRGSDVTPTYYKCDNTLYDGLYPSDHWPVYADFTIGTSDSVTE